VSHRLFLDRGVVRSSGVKGEVDRIPRELINPLCESEARHGAERTTRRDNVPFSWSFVCDTRRMDEQSQVDGQGDTAGFSPCLPVTDMRAALGPR
jgi:hypothetical protein